MTIRNFALVLATGFATMALGGCPSDHSASGGRQATSAAAAPETASLRRDVSAGYRLPAAIWTAATGRHAAATSTSSTFHFLAPQMIRLGEVGEVDSVATGDIDGDSRTDAVVVTNFVGEVGFGTSRKVLVLRQSPQGTLLPADQIDYKEYAGDSPDVATGDFDRDGRDDIVVGHMSGFTVVRYGPGEGYSTSVHYVQPCQFVVLLDIDKDGALDIACLDGPSVDFYYGDGSGNFPRTSSLSLGQYGWQDMETADVTGDGIPDLVLFCDDVHSELRVYPGVRGGGFSAAVIYPFADNVGATGPSPRGIVTGDFNDDGRTDVALSMNESDTAFYIMQQSLQGTLLAPFAQPTYSVPAEMAAADFDGDGDDDFVVRYAGWYLIGYLPQSAGRLGSDVKYEIPGLGGGVPNNNMAVGDINGDECPDVLIADGYNLVTIEGAGCIRKSRRTGGAAQIHPVP